MSFWKWFRTKFHSHEWEIHQEMPVRIFDDSYVGDESKIVKTSIRYILRCKICGEITSRDI